MSFASKFYLAATSVLFPTSALAACPDLVPGAAFPWQKSGILPGDQVATLYIDVAANGRPTACRVGANNLPDSETRFFTCQAMLSQGKFEQEMKNGTAIASTVKREMVMYGREHAHQDEIARKKYFIEHPDERSSCYPY